MQLLAQSVIRINHSEDYETLIRRAGDTQIILIGDSTHGTHEFYQQRINISKRLIKEQNYKLIALEAGWPDIYLLNQYIQGLSPLSVGEIYNRFTDQPDWLWKNQEMLDFVHWLRAYNAQLPAEARVSLYGIDLYSFDYSRHWVIQYLLQFSPAAAQQAMQRYQCVKAHDSDLHRYGQAVSSNLSHSCEREFVAQFNDFMLCRFPCPEQYPVINRDDYFTATQNARILKNIEKNVRVHHFTHNPVESWNIRDEHMLETLLALLDYKHQPKAIVWAHNSHLGDASATGMAEKNQLNLGQLLRQHFNQQLLNIGMLTYSGQVIATDRNEKRTKIMALSAAHPETNEAIFHALQIPRFLLFLKQSSRLYAWMNKKRPQRHVGVNYNSQEEVKSHYSYTHLADQFDAILYIDSTTALTLLNY